VEPGSPSENASKINLARILLAKPVSTFAEYAPGYEFETGESDSGVAMGCAALSASEHDRGKSGFRFSEGIMLRQT
jgi:hypothetical protein